MAPFSRSSDTLPVKWRQERYFYENCYNSINFYIKDIK